MMSGHMSVRSVLSAAVAVVSLQQPAAAPPVPVISVPAGSVAAEQTSAGTEAGAALVASFDGLGVGFEGPQGTANLRQPSDNSLAVGRDHIVQIVNSRTAIFTKRGRRFDTTGRALYGPVPTNNVFRGFGGECEAKNNGDAVVRYDQLADRWLIVMPIFSRGPSRPDQPSAWTGGAPAHVSPPGRPPDRSAALYQPPPAPPDAAPAGRRGQPGQRPPPQQGPYSMCYAVSVGPDPLGGYYRYEFLRPLFPDYPRPAVWPDGYYLPTSTGDEVIQKHACVVERAKMLEGQPATEQCVVIDGVNFLNNADLDGTSSPAAGCAEHHDGRRRHAVEGGLRGRRDLRVAIPRGLEEPGEDRGHRTREDQRSRRITTCATASCPTACPSRAPIGGSTRRGTRSWRGSCTAGWATASPSWPCTR